jgi:hypothetical protein
MNPRITDRERLAADLELLGILADPSRGPLASFYAPPPPVESVSLQAPPTRTWRRRFEVVLAWLQRMRATRSAGPLRTSAAANR